MPGSVTDKDRGFKRIKRAFKLAAKASDPHVAVGLRGNGPAGQTHGSADKTVAEIGSIHEFGIGNMPERSFIREPFDGNLNSYITLTQDLSRRVATGKLSLRNALGLLGAKAVGDVQAKMVAGIAPDRADGTVAQLIDTGQMRDSVDFEVRNA